MARWTPDSNIGKHENIGRRLFDEPMLVGSENKKPFQGLDLRHFEEKRDGQVSLDRLGRTSIEKAAVRYLIPRATAASLKFKPPKLFNGWAVVQAHYIESSPAGVYALPIVYSPVMEDELEELEKNIFHVHVVTPDGVDHYSMALHLRHLFTKYGDVHSIKSEGERQSLLLEWKQWLFNQNKRLLHLVRQVAPWLRNKFNI